VEEIQVLYLDEDLVVCCKPRGILSQAGGEADMISRLQSQLGGDIYPVHRLDREVGGVMVYARTKQAAAALSQSIQAGTVKKEYLAVVLGVPEQENGILEDLLLHDARKNKSYVVKRMRGGVRKAKLSYQVLETQEGRSLIQVRLFTGRTHQIRVQFASRQMPLQGDGRYGGGSGKIALWSVRLTFPHPKTGKLCVFQLFPESLGEFQAFPPLAEME
jgi:23S rRNA pseudouridine1911/1915/1917 synthase